MSTAATVASILTIAEVAPFAMFTNASLEELFYLRLICEPHMLLIAENTCSTEIVA